jgi:PHO85 cyclin-5
VARRDADMDFLSKDEEAARALQELHSHPRSAESPNRVGAKRSRTESIDSSLQENVREILSGRCLPCEAGWSDHLLRSRADRVMEISPNQVAVRSTSVASLGRKRVCCATEATRGLPASGLHPALGGIGGPGMWEGILN